ncbi:MAG TPA: ECF transporter S component [Anaerolineales bacterium]|nr:ECF transporter S component [Anaerolineales bacterium]
MAKQSASKWSTRDLMVTIVIGLAFGVLLIPVTYAYAALLSLGILARSLLGGVYYLPAAFAAYVIRKPGSILLVSLVSALVAMPFTAYGFIVLLIGALTGLIGELVTWFFTRYRNFALGRLALAGAVGGLLEFLLILGSLRSTSFELGILSAALLVSALTFGLCAALAKVLADAVARTGVLANTALGRTNIEEI